MKQKYATEIIFFFLLCALIVPSVAAQKRSAAKTKPIVFAVLMDGERIEPIGEIDKGKLVGTVGGDADAKSLSVFAQKYYRPKTAYNLIFGGAKNGTVTINNFNTKSDCGKNSANVTAQSTRAKLKGMVMGLATSLTPPKNASGVRRLPTAAERAEVEALVRAEFIKQGVSATRAAKNLKYHNLTALDVDGYKTAELIGSFWTENSARERNLLFFIAEKGKGGRYEFGFSEYSEITPDKVMSGELKDLDEGIYHELLLDALEYDGDDAAAEIFTVIKAFESYSYNVYSRRKGKWTKVFEGSNYHCAY